MPGKFEDHDILKIKLSKVFFSDILSLLDFILKRKTCQHIYLLNKVQLHLLCSSLVNHSLQSLMRGSYFAELTRFSNFLMCNYLPFLSPFPISDIYVLLVHTSDVSFMTSLRHHKPKLSKQIRKSIFALLAAY